MRPTAALDMQPIPSPPSRGETGSHHYQGTNGERLEIQILDQDLVRVNFQARPEPRMTRSWMINAPEREGRRRDDLSSFPQPAHQAEGCRLQTERLTVSVALSPELALTWSDANGPFAKDLKYRYDKSGRSVWHYLEMGPTDRYYGFGEKAGPLDKAGLRMRMHNVDAMGYDARTSDPLYKHYPLYITFLPERQLAYALIYDNLASCVFDLGCERDAYHGRYRYYQADDGDLDYYLVYGPTLERVIERISELTGKIALPPRWSLGYQGSTMSYTEAPDSQQQLKRFVELCQQHEIPCNLFHLSSGYTLDAAGRRNVFTWNRERVPDPTAMVANFVDAGIQLAANIKPCLLTTHPEYSAVASLFVRQAESDEPEVSVFWGGQGSYLDFTNPDTCQWWREKVTEQVLSFGIASTWNDNNEFEIWDDEARCAGFGEPFPIGLARPLQTLLMVRSSWEAQRAHRPGQRPFLITRAGCPGIGRYAQTWSGDNSTSWDSLRWNIPMGLGLSLSGMPNFGHDVGGFAGPAPGPELLVRWVQNGVFHPRFCIHSWNSDQSVNEPWMHPEVLPIVRHWIAFRYRLLPYLYALFWECSQTGHPILRPMVYHFPEDPRCQSESFDFLLGPFLLVASVLEEGARSRTVYLPGDRPWCELATGRWFEPGQEVVLSAPLEQIPLLVRAGGILPTTDEIWLFPGPSGVSSFAWVEDDGISEGGPGIRVEVRMEANSETVRVTGPSTRYCLPIGDLRQLVTTS